MSPLKLSFVILAYTFSVAHAGALDADGTLGKSQADAKNNSDQALDQDEKSKHLMHEAHEHEHEAHEHPDADGEPNHEMMEKAHHEFREARAMNLQAREFAKAALLGLKSVGAQQAQNASGLAVSSIDVPRLQQIAGDTGAAPDVIQSGSAGSVGFQSGSPNPDAEAAAALPASDGSAGVNSTLTASRSPASVGGAAYLPGQPLALKSGAFGTSAGTLGAQGMDDPNAKMKNDPVAPDVGSAAIQDPLAAKKKTAQEIQNALDRNRMLISKQLGLPSRSPADVGPIRAPKEDIFQAMHNHYSSLREKGVFYEFNAPAESPGPAEKPPAYYRGF